MLPIVPAILTRVRPQNPARRFAARRWRCGAGLLATLLGVFSLRSFPFIAAVPSGSVRVVAHGSYPELQVDGKPFFIHAAAFLYPRIPRALWEPSLDRYGELGINTIDLTIPWNWHEVRPGEYDFDGRTNPRRDLRGLLQFIALHGFKLIVRPGPAVPREWRNAGYPDWIVEDPAFHIPLVDRLEGRAAPPGASGASARRWLEAVARELAPFNSDATLRSGDAAISGPLLFVGVEPGAVAPAADAARAGEDSAQSLCDAIGRGGANAPCFQNVSRLAGFDAPVPIAAMGQWYLLPAADSGDAVREITAADVADIAFTARALAAQPAFPPALIEYDPGWFAPQQDSRPQAVALGSTRLSRALFWAAGVHGISWFPFQDVLTPAGFGTPWSNRYYRWDAPLALNRARQPRAAEAARSGDWLRVWGGHLAASHPRADFGLATSLGAFPAADLSHSDPLAAAVAIMQLQRLAQFARLTPELVDPARQPVEQLLRHALILLPVVKTGNATVTLGEAAQSALAAYVRAGGTLVCFPEVPVGAAFVDLQHEPVAPRGPLPQGTREWKAGAGRFIELTKDFYSWVLPAEDFVAGMKRFEAPFSISLLDALLDEAGIRASVRLDAPDS